MNKRLRNGKLKPLIPIILFECNCPGLTALATIVAQNCGVDLKQIQRLGFQRTQADPTFTATTIVDLAEWQALMTATDATKIVISPKIGGDPTIEAGAPITTGGGDNSTLNGIEEVEGTNPAPFKAFFKSMQPLTEKSMKNLNCETNLTVYLFLQGNRVVAKNLGGTPNNLNGFPIQSFYLSDRQNSGFGTKDRNNLQFFLAPGWSEDMSLPITLEFNPVTDL